MPSNKQTDTDKLQKEIKHLKEEIVLLKQSKELIDAQNATLFANLSHEFRNPLNGIMGFAELLRTGDVSCEDVKAYTSVIEESGRELLGIVTDVFDLSKIRAGQFKVYPEAFDLNDLLFELLMKYRDIAESAGLQLFVENMISEEYIISSSPVAINRILNKLLDNAIKYTKSGWIKMSYSASNKGVLIFRVEDTGIGIQEPTRSNLFNRFIELEVSKTRKVSGTGLDLTLCSGLVELLGGEIWHENREDGGSVFQFTVKNHTITG
ncbi:MAG: HAMP domain-containing sensor histidine kinase [Prolixibacteraceae bacterium]|jgi:signal transduction histidine kinase|nr:HAMP domain-containing sensor histidine kinase [Prolixibacteraceae bacterium]